MEETRKLTLTGIVQGVGFRPFVYRLAHSLNLRGRVINTGEEVEILLEGEKNKLEEFTRKLMEEKPAPSEIYSLSSEKIDNKNFTTFKIAESKEEPGTLSMVPPDFGICGECLDEIEDPNSRRYTYPFNSCARCGPRFSAIEKVPYDRENTSMREYPLCDLCQQEYTNRENIRRGHIQGISCPKCGPKLRLTTSSGKQIETSDPISRAAKLIENGRLIGIKGMGGFHIASLATDDTIVKELRERKNRPQKPFALMALNLQTAKKIVKIGDKEQKILKSPKCPIFLLPKRKNSPVSDYVAPGLRKLGVMLAYTGIHYLLLKNIKDRFLIMTSGNPRGEPICKSNACAWSKLSNKVDYFLLHDRKIFNRTDDSVVRLTDTEPTMLRRSRGYAPTWFSLPFKLKKPRIAFGADLKNVGGVGIKDKAIPTQYIGDMDNVKTLNFFKEAITFLTESYGIDPGDATLVADLHPRYHSRTLAEEWKEKFNTELELVQHHYAHTVAGMIDNDIPVEEKVIGISIDGVGYGTDGNIWGGEILVADYEDWKRVGHLQYHPMPGGDRATKYPMRMLIGMLTNFMESEEIKAFIKKMELLQGLPHKEEELQVVLKQANAPTVLTSSMGRVLDSISALLGVCLTRNYEGEPAMKLESIAHDGDLIEGFEIPRRKENGKLIIQSSYLLRSLVDNLDKRKSSLAFTAQFELGRALGKVAQKAAERVGAKRIITSGGAAVNTHIVRGIRKAVSRSNLAVLLPNRIPPGDGGIGLGQMGILFTKGRKPPELDD